MKDENLGYILYYARKRRRITQCELASQSNIPQSTIAYIEKASRDKYSRKHIAQAFHVLHIHGELYNDTGLHELLSKGDVSITAQCAILNTHFASLDPHYYTLFGEILAARGIPLPDTGYIHSELILKLVEIAAEANDGFSSVFSSKSDLLASFVTPFDVIDDIISEHLNNPFYRLCMALKLKPYDDMLEISLFLCDIMKIKFSKPGFALDAISRYFNEFMLSRNRELTTTLLRENVLAHEFIPKTAGESPYEHRL